MNNANQRVKEKWISDAAYYKYLNRGFTPGSADKDWLEAEQEYHELIKKRIKAGLVRIA